MAHTINLREKRPEPSHAPSEPASKAQTSSKTENVSSAIKTDISWTAQIFANPPFKSFWSLATVFFLSSALVLFFQHDFIFGVLLALAGLIIVLRGYHISPPSQISIRQFGVTIDNEKYLYSQIECFWLNYQPGQIKELILKLKKWNRSLIYIPLESVSPLEIRAFVIQYIPEKELSRSVLEEALRRIGF